MTDLLTVLPRLSSAPFSNLLPSLERSRITVADLLTLDVVEVAKRAQLPAREVRRLTEAVLETLHSQLKPHHVEQELVQQDEGQGRDQIGVKKHAENDPASFLTCNGAQLTTRWQTISCLDDGLDTALGGGFPTGYLSEVTGESGVGKTHLLLSLLLAVQLPSPHGLSRNAVYISTEASISTPRLQQILSTHPYFVATTPLSTTTVSLSRIFTLQTADLESQDHIIRYQLPLALRRHNVGLVVIDSITANFRAEFERRTGTTDVGRGRTISNGPASMARRSASLIEMAATLRGYAREYGVAIVVANQVADRFSHHLPQFTSSPMSVSADSIPGSMQVPSESEAPSSSPLVPSHPDDEDVHIDKAMTLDHQQRWFTGWGDEVPHRTSTAGMKTPSLGMVWTNQLACRIALTRRLVRDVNAGGRNMRWQRHLKVVFAPWCRDHAGTRGIEFNVENRGLVSVVSKGRSTD